MSYASSFSVNLLKEVSSLSVFQGVEPDILREMMTSAHVAQYQKGAILLAQGADVSRCYMMLEGWCGASKGNAEGQEALLQIFRRGDFLFELAPSMETDICPINLQALTPVHLLMLAPGTVRLAAEHSVAFMGNLLSASMRRCRDLRDHIEQLTLHNAEQRVGRFLLRLRFSENPEGKDIVLPIDKAHIAAYLGIKPETLSRVFQSFKEKGFTIDRSHLTLPSELALCGYCDKITMQSCPFVNTKDCLAVASKAALEVH